MPDKAWKAFERRIATVFGGERRGADYGDVRGGKSDVIREGWSIECKLLGQPTWARLLAAVEQSQAAASSDEIPVAVVKRKNQADSRTLVLMSMSDFIAWFGPQVDSESDSASAPRHEPDPEIE